MMESTNIQIQLKDYDLTLTAKTWGPRNSLNTPVLALHGWLDNSASFDLLIPEILALKPSTFIVALDLVGHGFSDHLPKGEAYAAPMLYLHLAAVLEALGWERAIILGHSLGGCLATHLAAVFPEKIESLFLIEGLALWSAPCEEILVRSKKYYEGHKDKVKKEAPKYVSKEEAAIRRSEKSDVTYEMAFLLAQQGCQQTSDGLWQWTTDPKLMLSSVYTYSEEMIHVFLKGIKCPVTLLRAADGLLHKDGFTPKRIPYVPALKVIDLPGGHHIHMENPKEIASYF